MSTLLEITNKVLRRLREDQVTDLTADYSALIASFVADIAQEVNEAGPSWSALDAEVDVTLSAGTATYALTGTTNKSTLLYSADGSPLVWSFIDSNDVYGQDIIQLDPNSMESLYENNRTLSNLIPSHFSIAANSTNTNLTLTVWPRPSATRYIRTFFNTPEAELSVTTDANTSIKVPNRPVYLGALFMAFNERGEEIGEPGGILEQRYNKALGAAVEEEIRRLERMGRYDWQAN